MKAASSFETGAAFAAFCVNFRSLLEKYGLCLVGDDQPQELEVYRDIFRLYEEAVKVYFENLPYHGIRLSPEMRNRWRDGIMTVRFGDQAQVVVPEDSRMFLDYAKTFFGLFFREAYGGADQTQADQVGSCEALGLVLTELALNAFVAFVAQEVATFLSASSDAHRRVALH